MDSGVLEKRDGARGSSAPPCDVLILDAEKSDRQDCVKSNIQAGICMINLNRALSLQTAFPNFLIFCVLCIWY